MRLKSSGRIVLTGRAFPPLTRAACHTSVGQRRHALAGATV